MPQPDRATGQTARADFGDAGGWWKDALTPSPSPFEPAPWRANFADPSLESVSAAGAGQNFGQDWDPSAWSGDQSYGDQNYGDQSYGDRDNDGLGHGTYDDPAFDEQTLSTQDWNSQGQDSNTWQTLDGQHQNGQHWDDQNWDGQNWDEPHWDGQHWDGQHWDGQQWITPHWQGRVWNGPIVDGHRSQHTSPYDEQHGDPWCEPQPNMDHGPYAWPTSLAAPHGGPRFADFPSPQAIEAQSTAHSPTRRAALLGLSGLGFVAIGGASTFGFLSAFRGPAHALGDRSASLAGVASARSTDSTWLQPVSRLALEQAEALEYMDQESAQAMLERPPVARLELASLGADTDIPPALPLRRPSASHMSPLPQTKPASVEQRALAWLRANPAPSETTPARSDAGLDAMIARLSEELGAPPQVPAQATAQPKIQDQAKKSPAPTAPLAAPKVQSTRSAARLRNVHNGETIMVAHRDRQGRLDPVALRELEVFMRDWRNDQTRSIDVGLYDQLVALAPSQELQVISAYRSPQTNAMLRARSGGVAKNSYHLRGQAIDISPSGVRLEDFYHRALRMNAGGVGYYPGSDFIHIDTGPIREWPSRYKARAQAYRKGLA